jgi:hypothetical protein
VIADRFAFAIRVSGQVNLIRTLRRLLQLVDELLLALDDDVIRAEVASIAKSFFGRSLMWPSDALTTKSLPRYLPMVFAFAGDSTMTRDLLIAVFQSTHTLM